MRLPEELATRDKILFLLKTRGPADAAALARRLAVTAIAARQHLQRLGDEGLVRFTEERRGVGRPARVWQLTDAARSRFPDNHADLTLELLTAARSAFGEEGIERLVAARTRQQLARYRRRLADAGPELGDRVAALARLRTEEGYMAEARRAGEDGWLLVENHCPICAAATACQGICSAELELFGKVLGPGCSVEHVEHIVAGARRCAYRVQEKRVRANKRRARA